MNFDHRINLLARLGEYIRASDTQLNETIQKASSENSWFTSNNIRLALSNIADQFLQKEKLMAFTSSWTSQPIQPKRVGIVMAGNIPLVGFHDFLCVFLSGHIAVVKLSSKDSVLFSHLINVMKDWEPTLSMYCVIAERLNPCDAYIATGSQSSGNYFEYYFSKKPHIIRKNKTSVAILHGDETSEELSLLADDVFLHFGLGCRNVTHVFVPNGYAFGPLLEAFQKYDELMLHSGYANNYDYQLAIQIINGTNYMTNGNVILLEQENVYSPIAVLHYSYSEDEQKLMQYLTAHEHIQCIVGKQHVAFGKTQCPSLQDYADGVDTMKFLLSL
jgi:hypothetical protein